MYFDFIEKTIKTKIFEKIFINLIIIKIERIDS